jgi:hypothetical protein
LEPSFGHQALDSSIYFQTLDFFIWSRKYGTCYWSPS